MAQQLLSIVVPCYNEEEVIRETHRQLHSELDRIVVAHDLRYEIIYVNDGSRDATLPILHELKIQHDSRYGTVRILALARNFGHQIALTAGLQHSRGDAIVAIDADLQDPPAVIEDMVQRWKDGVDVAYGMRLSREGETWFKLISAKVFYIIVKKVTRLNIPLDTGDFRLMSRRSLEVFHAMPEQHRFIRGMIPWIGFRQEAVPYHRAKRFAGATKYPFSKMLTLAVDGITSFSNAPLHTAFLSGMLVAGLCVLYAIWAIFEKVMLGTPQRGWTSLMVVVLFLGAVQLMSIGVLGEYVGRIYDEVKRRPLFILDKQQSRLDE